MSSDLYVTMEDIGVNRLHGIDIGFHNRLVAMCRYYDLNWFRFVQSVKLHWNRTYAPTPVHLLRLKKPILPNRGIRYREGWWSEAWGFTNADLTPYALEEAAAKLVEEIRDPRFKRAMDAVLMQEGFTIGEEGL